MRALARTVAACAVACGASAACSRAPGAAPSPAAPPVEAAAPAPELAEEPAPETFVARELVREPLLEDGGIEVLEQRADAPVSVDVLAPSWWRADDAAVESSDLPALVMPPPASAVFEVEERGGPLVLRAAVGAHADAHDALPAGTPSLEVGFELSVDGDVRWSGVVPVGADTPSEARRWHPVTGADGEPLELPPGSLVRLRTFLPAGLEASPPAAALRVGFGRLALERRVARAAGEASEERPNLVLIVMDTQRRDRLGCYGSDAGLTPHTDALARRGLLYEEAYATSSWTWPSTASLLTGLRPEEHGVTSNRSCWLAGELDTLAEALARSGYRTAGFSANPIVAPDKNFDQGFAHFDHGPRFRTGAELAPAVLAWLDAHAGQRFFLYVQLADPHTPHEPLPELSPGPRPPGWPQNPEPDHPAAAHFDGFDRYAQRLLRGELAADEVPAEHVAHVHAMYDACVASGDRAVGRILERLDALGLADTTVVAYTSDHGEELFDHGLLAHGHTLHEELVAAPLLLAGPGIAAGERVATPVSNRHLAQTLARLGGAELAGAPLVMDLARADTVFAAPVPYSTEKGWWCGAKDRALRGLRDQEWILHRCEDPPAGARSLRLYRAGQAPPETEDLAADEVDVVERLGGRLDEQLAEMEGRRPRLGAAVPAGEATAAQLEALGYFERDEEPDPVPEGDGGDGR